MILLVRAAALLTILACANVAHALDPTRALTQSVQRIWQVQQGLPQAWIYSVVQASDGYLWLGTQAGLVKFDGVRFARLPEYEMAGVSNDKLWVTHVIEDSEHALWVGTAQAGLIRLQAGSATRYASAQGLPDGKIQCLFGDKQGSVWACLPTGLAELTHGTIRVLGVADGLPEPDVRGACMAPDGTLYAATAKSRLAAWSRSRFVERRLPLPESATVQALLCGSDGVVWVGSSQGLIRIGAGREARLTRADGLADDSVLALAEGRDGSVLVGTTNGFSRVRPGFIDSFGPKDGLSQSTVYALHEDRDGSLWVATKHGLNQFIDSRGLSYTTSEGLPSNSTGPVLQDRQGTIWVGTLDGGLARFDGRAFTTLTEANGLTANAILALSEDSDGDLWVGTASGLNRLRQGRVTATWTTRNGLPDNRVRALYRDAAGAMWIATPGGAAVFRRGALTRVPDPRGSTASPILAFGERSDHQVFAAPEETSSLEQADALYRDRQGLIWVGTIGRGLRLMDGERTTNFSVLDGLFDDVIYGIAEDDQGRLWMACSKGIFFVNRSDLIAFAAGTIRSFESTPYSPLEALRTVECQAGVQPAVAKTADGRLWFSTIRGVIVIDPHHFERRLVPPAVTVESVVVNGERRPAGTVQRLAAGLNNVEFSYGAASLVAPARISFRYRLEGIDSDWIHAGPRREAFYANLPPGRFRFIVAACTPDGACNENSNPIAFAIAPRLYQRWWFSALAVVALSLGGVAVYRLRIRTLKDQFDLVLAERGRIARELHDTLIQGFSGITMAMQAMVSRLPSSQERQTLEGIVADAGVAMRDARRSLMGLRTHDSQSGLAAAVEQVARQVTNGHEMRLKLQLVDPQAELAPEVAYNLVRVTQEAVLNAVKHSEARVVKVTLNGSPHQVQLSVSDDGIGFDHVMAGPEGHFGLVGMRERAAHIGADLQIVSEPGRGTTVSVQVAT